MNDRPLVSGIIIFLNAERFIQEAIASVFAQTYDNWELVLVDDGSIDSSTDIARQYAEQYPEKVLYTEHPDHQNRGMSASRNLGLRHAKGKYVAFLDADDVWLPQKLDQQVAILERHPEAALVFGPWQAWYSWQENATRQDRRQELYVQPDTLIQPPKLVALWLQMEGMAIPGHCATLVRKAVCHDVGGFEEAFKSQYEDLVFLTKVCLKATVFVAGDGWSRYRQHADSHSAVALQRGQVGSAWLYYLSWLEAYLLQQNVKQTTVWTILQKKLWPSRHRVLHGLLRPTWRLASQMKRLLKLIARWLLPASVLCWLRRHVIGYRRWQGAWWVQ